MSTPDKFFSAIERDDAGKLCRWAGELYLELHNGTYTTHARVKKMNRKCEFLLHDAEFMICIAMYTQGKGGVYPHEELIRLWKLLLLNQFHDVLPGSSIGMVCGQKWSDISEFGFGVAVLNDCKYGHSAVDNTLRMSLYLQDSELNTDITIQMVNILSSVGGLNLRDNVKKIMEKLMKNDPMSKFNLVGGKQKRSIKSSAVFGLVMASAMKTKLEEGLTEQDVKSAIQTTLKLRSPKWPDDNADMELHEFTYALMPHLGTFQVAGVIKHAYCLNSPLIAQYHVGFFSVANPQVVLETVKRNVKLQFFPKNTTSVLQLLDLFDCAFRDLVDIEKAVHTCDNKMMDWDREASVILEDINGESTDSVEPEEDEETDTQPENVTVFQAAECLRTMKNFALCKGQ